MKEKVLNWAKQFNTFCFLDNNRYRIKPHHLECLLAAGKRNDIRADAGDAVHRLQSFIHQHNTNLFGHLGFDLKNETEGLLSAHPDRIGFPDLYFFEPEILIRLNENEIIIEGENPGRIYRDILEMSISILPEGHPDLIIRQSMNRDSYIEIIEQLRRHIIRGDCYEINFCQEFFAEKVTLDPVAVYKRLTCISPNPFSALYRTGDKWLICASPERFLKKTGREIISQPIKGTLKRSGKTDDGERRELFRSQKDRAENVMVVDLVRNDLSKVCTEGSIKVDELFGIYTFPQVHHMISTVSGELKETAEFSSIIRAAFPMGSMTGAPKKRVLQLIEQYETAKRGIFSGALGYICPASAGNFFPGGGDVMEKVNNNTGVDFDFNVVIRSIMYNATEAVLSFQTGSGITFYSDAGKEWEECLLKAAAIKQVLCS